MLNLRLIRQFVVENNFSHVMSKKTKSASNQKKDKISEKDESPITLDKSKNILISILAKPGAKQNAITDISPEGIGVQINAPPMDGEANVELVKYLASVLDLRKSDVTLDRGFKSKAKVLKVTGNTTVEEVRRKILNEITS